MFTMTTVLFAAMGILCGVGIGHLMDILPAKSFCDYGEVPGEEHLPPRVSKRGRALCGFLLAVVFPLLKLRSASGWECISLCLFASAILMAALSDSKFCIIPDETIILGCVAAVSAAVPRVLAAQSLMDKLSPVIGAGAALASMLAIHLLGRLLFGKDGLGMGDVKLMLVCGIACGGRGVLIALLIGILAAALWFGAVLALKRAALGAYLPLGPFLVLGALTTLCFRPQINALLTWYITHI